MAIPLPIETARLVVRSFTRADVEPMLAVYGDPDVMRLVAGGVRSGAAAVRAELEMYARLQDELGFSSWAVVERASGRVVGDVGLGVLEETGNVEIGWTLARDRWGLGYATEAAAASLASGLAHLHVPRIVAVMDVENAASARVAERIGMRLEGELELHGRPHLLWAATSEGRAPRQAERPGSD
ncbi:MAG: GNAT family N-acetyltransferase, partial [Gaiellaceae bacterium]